MGHVTSLFAHKMAAAAGDAIDQKEILAFAGLDPDAGVDPRVMIVDTVYYDFLEKMAERIDITAVPLEAGKLLSPDDYGALGLAWKAAPTLMGSFSRVERYARLWTSVVEYELRPADNGTFFVLHRGGTRRLGLRLSNEATLASAVSISRQVCPIPFSPLEVHLKHGPPKTLVHHEAYFGCPVIFGSDLDAILVSPGALAQPNILGDEGITRFLLSHLDQELGDIGVEETLESRARDAVARALSEGMPKMADVAQGLGMSARSFHRRLSEHGLSFQSLAEATRRDIAMGMLKEESYSLSEIAFLAGFSEQSAFTRAFKRWTGHTPAQFRKSAGAV